jgi:hypothetical protein
VVQDVGENGVLFPALVLRGGLPCPRRIDEAGGAEEDGAREVDGDLGRCGARDGLEEEHEDVLECEEGGCAPLDLEAGDRGRVHLQNRLELGEGGAPVDLVLVVVLVVGDGVRVRELGDLVHRQVEREHDLARVAVLREQVEELLGQRLFREEGEEGGDGRERGVVQHRQAPLVGGIADRL